MKNLKFGLFSLLAILTISIFMTSCGKEEIQPTLNQTVVTELESSKLVLPFGVSEDQILITAYLDNATPEQITIWKQNFKITESLASIGKLNKVQDQLSVGQNISEFNLSQILSEIEIINLDYNTQVESRGCTPVMITCCWTMYKCCKPPFGNCYYYVIS